MDAEAEAPLFPTHLVAVNLETRLALRNFLRRLDSTFALITLVDGREVAALAPLLVDAVVLQLADRLRRQVREHGQVFDGAVLAGEHRHERTAVAIRGARRVGAKGIAQDGDIIEILDAAFLHGFAPAWIGAKDGGG